MKPRIIDTHSNVVVLPIRDVAAAYDLAGSEYVAYADGDPNKLFQFESLHGYADRRLWSILEAQLRTLRQAGSSSVRLLDAGCGAGTWLRRAVTCAHSLGFTSITARGFDVAEAQIQTARALAEPLTKLAGVNIAFDVANLRDRMPEVDQSVDIALCLYSVLSHLPISGLPDIAAEFARVTRGDIITSVRPVGSPPTIFISTIDKARRFRLDHETDRCEFELHDGQRMSIHFHLFNSQELRGYFAPHFEIKDLFGLDIFHHRFQPDDRWNPRGAGFDAALADHLEELEERFSRDPAFIDRATHLLLTARVRPQRRF